MRPFSVDLVSGVMAVSGSWTPAAWSCSGVWPGIFWAKAGAAIAVRETAAQTVRCLMVSLRLDDGGAAAVRALDRHGARRPVRRIVHRHVAAHAAQHGQVVADHRRGMGR